MNEMLINEIFLKKITQGKVLVLVFIKLFLQTNWIVITSINLIGVSTNSMKQLVELLQTNWD